MSLSDDGKLWKVVLVWQNFKTSLASSTAWWWLLWSSIKKLAIFVILRKNTNWSGWFAAEMERDKVEQGELVCEQSEREVLNLFVKQCSMRWDEMELERRVLRTNALRVQYSTFDEIYLVESLLPCSYGWWYRELAPSKMHPSTPLYSHLSSYIVLLLSFWRAFLEDERTQQVADFIALYYLWWFRNVLASLLITRGGWKR